MTGKVKTVEDVDPQQKTWDEFVSNVSKFIDSGELDEQEVEYKLNLGREFAEAREAVLYGAEDWSDQLTKGGLRDRKGHPMTWLMTSDLKQWISDSPDDALKAFQTLWERGDKSVSERIRAFNEFLPKDPAIRGKEGTRIRIISTLLMGLGAEDHPPFATETFKKAYKQTGYKPPGRGADEAELYEHALRFLDQFRNEMQARGVRLRHRLDAQSVVWHWRGQPDDLPQLDLSFPKGLNGVNIENCHAGWDLFVLRAKELIASDRWNKQEIAPKLKIQDMAKRARKAVLADADNWEELVRSIFTSEGVYFLTREKIHAWIDESPEDALQAFKASWAEGSLSVEQRIRAFCERFPKETISGKGSRLTVAATLLAASGVTQFPPFSRKKYDDAYKQTGWDAPDQNADEAELYVHALVFLDRFIEMAESQGVALRHRLNAFAVVWNVIDSLFSVSTQPVEPKSLHTLADELLLPPNFLEKVCALLEDKRQVIFQGPPGTGKTFVAQALAKCLAVSEDRLKLVQFHPSYAYEDFVQGYRPRITESGQIGFALQDGPLLRAAQKAREEPNANHFLIIDEINRGNLAKVLGELYFLLEYREEKIRMQYQQDDEDDFSLPENLYIIGTMNTADRSIALVDLALRRRFYFIEFHPDKEPVKSVLREWLTKNAPGLEWVAKMVELANGQLKDDRHAAIGPSYFMKDDLDEPMVKRIWEHSVLPYVEERLFGENDNISEFEYTTLRDQAKQNGKAKRSEEQAENDAEVQEESE